ncbi:MAG: histidinol-phosphate transaminase [Anaerolineales bacterium]
MQLPAHLQNLPAYIPGESVDSLAARLGRKPESIIKLDANENNYGTPPAVDQALAKLDYTHRYPDAEQRDLRAALSAYTGVPADFLLAGNGSDELLSLMSQVLLEPGESILVCPPTFSMYAFYAHLKNCDVVNVPRRADFSLNLDKIISAIQARSPKIIYLDNPGNPTGVSISIEDISRLLALPILIVLDEAYLEFTGSQSLITEVPDRQNLVVLRTFSKWAGLAGFRIGYGAFPKWLGDVLWQAKSPYNVTVPAMTAAMAALSEIDFLKSNISRVIADRDRLAAELNRFKGLSVYPSDANFLLVKVEPSFRKSATEICDFLKEQGLLVRLFESMDCLRITIGKTDEMKSLLEALSEL